MRILIYSRKSRFTGRGESIENQIELCRSYISRCFGDIETNVTVFEDEGFSGRNLDRPQFRKMLDIIDREKVDYIVCYRLDRISRSVSDFSGLISDLNKKKVGLICIREQFDTTNPMGRAMMYIASVFAQLERETIAERISDNMSMLAKTGRWLGGITPLGFRTEKEDKISIDNRVRSVCKLAGLKKELELVQFIFDRFHELKSLNAVSRCLAEHGYHTRQGRDFSPTAIRMILTNPVYCRADTAAFDYFKRNNSVVCFGREACSNKYGIMTYNKTNRIESENGRQRQVVISEWIVAIGRHKGLISGERWTAIQDIIGAEGISGGLGRRKTLSSPALLSGLLVCKECGYFMRPHIYKERRGADGQAAFYYVCENKEKSRRANCVMQNASGNKIDDIVCDEIARYAEPHLPAYRALQRLKQRIKPQEGCGDVRQGLVKRLWEQRNMIQNLILALADGVDDDAAFLIKEQINQLSRQCSLLETELVRTEFGASNRSESCSLIESAVSTLRDFRYILASADTVSKKALLREVIERITWDGKELHIFMSSSISSSLLSSEADSK